MGKKQKPKAMEFSNPMNAMPGAAAVDLREGKKVLNPLLGGLQDGVAAAESAVETGADGVETMALQAAAVAEAADELAQGRLGRATDQASRAVSSLISLGITLVSAPIALVYLGMVVHDIIEEQGVMTRSFLPLVLFPALSYIGAIYIVVSYFLHEGSRSDLRMRVMQASVAAVVFYGTIITAQSPNYVAQWGYSCRTEALVAQIAFLTQMTCQCTACYTAYKFISENQIISGWRQRAVVETVCFGLPFLVAALLFISNPDSFNDSRDEFLNTGWCGVKSKHRLLKAFFVYAPPLIGVTVYAFCYYYIHEAVHPLHPTRSANKMDETKLSTSRNAALKGASEGKTKAATVRTMKSLRYYMTGFMLSYLLNPMVTLLQENLKNVKNWTEWDYLLQASTVAFTGLLWANVFASRSTAGLTAAYTAAVKSVVGPAVAISKQAGTLAASQAAALTPDALAQTMPTIPGGLPGGLPGTPMSVSGMRGIARTQAAKMERMELMADSGAMGSIYGTGASVAAANWKLFAFCAQTVLFIPVAMWTWVPITFLEQNFTSRAGVFGALMFYTAFFITPILYFSGIDRTYGCVLQCEVPAWQFEWVVQIFVGCMFAICYSAAYTHRYDHDLLVIDGPKNVFRKNRKNIMGCMSMLVEFYQINTMSRTASKLDDDNYFPPVFNATAANEPKSFVAKLKDNKFWVFWYASLFGVGLWAVIYCLPAVVGVIGKRSTAAKLQLSFGPLYGALAVPGFLTILKTMMKPLFCIVDPSRLNDPDAPMVVLPDITIECWSDKHLYLVAVDLTCLLIFFPSATLTNVFTYGDEEDLRYLDLYRRGEYLVKGVIGFTSLRFAGGGHETWALMSLCAGSFAIMVMVRAMKPCCFTFANNAKFNVHICAMWTALTCLWAKVSELKGEEGYEAHKQVLLAGYAFLWACQIAYVLKLRSEDVFRKPAGDAKNISKSIARLKRLRRKITDSQGIKRWGTHAYVIELLRFCEHQDKEARALAFETIAVLAYQDQMTAKSFFLQYTADVAADVLVDCVHVEEDEDIVHDDETRTFAVRALTSYLQMGMFSEELAQFDSHMPYSIADPIAELATTVASTSAKVDAVQCVLEMGLADSNHFHSVRKSLLPLLGQWLEHGDIVQQHTALATLCNVASRFDMVNDVINSSCMPAALRLFMTAKDASDLPPSPFRGFSAGKGNPVNAEVLIHQLPVAMKASFKKTFKDVKSIGKVGGLAGMAARATAALGLTSPEEALNDMDESGDGEVDLDEFLVWIMSDSALANKIREKQGQFGDAQARALFDNINTDGDDVLDEMEIAAYLAREGFGGKEELADELTSEISTSETAVTLTAEQAEELRTGIMINVLRMLTELSGGALAPGRNTMIVAGALDVLKAALDCDAKVQVESLGALGNFLAGRFSMEDLQLDDDMSMYYDALGDFRQMVEARRDGEEEEAAEDQVFELSGLTAGQRRKAHVACAFSRLPHESRGPPDNRVIVATIAEREPEPEEGAEPKPPPKPFPDMGPIYEANQAAVADLGFVRRLVQYNDIVPAPTASSPRSPTGMSNPKSPSTSTDGTDLLFSATDVLVALLQLGKMVPEERAEVFDFLVAVLFNDDQGLAVLAAQGLDAIVEVDLTPKKGIAKFRSAVRAIVRGNILSRVNEGASIDARAAAANQIIG